MPVTVTSLSLSGSLTYGTLKQYATDQLQDKSDEKGVRRAGRVVNRALRYVASEKLWTWHRIRHRIVERPRVTVNGVSIAAEGNVVTLLSGTLPSNAADATFYLSGDTEMMRVYTRDSGAQMTMQSTDVHVASAAVSNGVGYLLYDRIVLPVDFRTIWTPPSERDYFKDLSFVTPEEMTYLRQTYAPTAAGSIYYTFEHNRNTGRYELLLWPAPSHLRSADFFIYVWPAEMSDDSDVAMWDPSMDYALYATIDLMAVKELRKVKEYATVEKAYRDSVMRAKQADNKNRTDRAAGEMPRRGTTIRRTRGQIADG